MHDKSRLDAFNDCDICRLRLVNVHNLQTSSGGQVAEVLLGSLFPADVQHTQVSLSREPGRWVRHDLLGD